MFTNKRFWLSIVFLIGIIGIVVFSCYLWQGSHEKDGKIVKAKIHSIDKAGLKGKDENIVEHKRIVKKVPVTRKSVKTISSENLTSKPAEKGPLKEISCAELEQQLIDFLSYLDKKSYVRELCGKKGILREFNLIVEKLEENPPVLSCKGGESVKALQNMYHFFRIMPRNDIRLIKRVCRREGDSLEVVIKPFYRWVFSENCSQPSTLLRPDRKTVYEYAAFFLKTRGGRAYLSRRADNLRLLITYYSILALNDARQRGIKKWNIDLRPIIVRLKEEIQKNQDLLYKKRYLDELNRIASNK